MGIVENRDQSGPVRKRIKSIQMVLENAGIEESATEAEWIVSHAAGVRRASLFSLIRMEKINWIVCDQIIETIVERRVMREPLQRIFGSWDFYGFEFFLGSEVLIPRPETEGLVELVSRWIQEHGDSESRMHGVDWGTGSGCIAVTLSRMHAQLHMTAVDISEAAVCVARENSRRHDVGNRIEFVVSDGLSGMSCSEEITFLVSNPPYISSRTIDGLEPEVRDHEPLRALDGGNDGLDAYRQIVQELQSLKIRPKFIALEIGADQGESILDVLEPLKQYEIEVRRDIYGKNRYVLARSL